MSRPKRYKVVEKLAQDLINDPEYINGVKERLVSGNPHWWPLEQMIWFYAWGKYVEKQQIDQTTEHKGGPVQLAFLDFQTFEEQHHKRISLVHGEPDDTNGKVAPPTDGAAEGN